MCNNPSQCVHGEWIWTFSDGNLNHYIIKSRECIKNPLAVGKWLIFVNRERVDTLWGLIQVQTKLGNLGVAAQVSSRLHADSYSKKGSHVISIYTSNFRDKEEVNTIRETLRTLGIHWRIYYKLNLDTLTGRYSNGKDGALSVYEG